MTAPIQNLGSSDRTTDWYDGDLNSDGNVGLDDLATLLTNIETPPAILPAASTMTVPEPSALCLLLIGFVASGAFRRRRRNEA